MKFVNLKKTTGCFDLIKQAFDTLIAPKYGIQNKALEKIRSGFDRTCEILFVNNQPKGLIVYKSKLQNEFGFEDVFELKTALLFDMLKNKGLGKYLFQQAELRANELKAKYIISTISTCHIRLLNSLKIRGWVISEKCKSSDNALDVYVIFKRLTKN